MADDLRVPMDPILDAFGVPATVTRPAPEETPIETTGVWLSTGVDAPGGGDVHRRERFRVIAFSRVMVPTAPRGTRIDAPEILDGPVKAWRVDGTADEDEDLVRLIVVPASEET